MRGIKLALVAALCVMLGGCSLSGDPENQAYALAMGLDRAEDGQLALTVRVPADGQSEESGNGVDTDSYITFSALGRDFQQALDAVKRLVPREINLGHLLLIAVSEEIAREEAFGELASQVAETPHLYANARLIVCRGSAGDFIDLQALTMGTRLSVEIGASMEHYEREGFIPVSTLADFCAVGNSVYSDPFAAMAEADPSSPTGERCVGAALFDDQNALTMALDEAQTRLFCLIAGSGKHYAHTWRGASIPLTALRRPRLRVSFVDGAPSLYVDLRLSIQGTRRPDDLSDLEEELAEKLEDLITVCQRGGLDPFGFGERAASRFLTLQRWQNYGWKARYATAPVHASVVIE